MQSDNRTPQFYRVRTNLLHIEQSLNGLSLLLEEISNKSQDQAQEISWCNSILKLIIRQTEETADLFNAERVK